MVDRALLPRKLADLERYRAQLGEYEDIDACRYADDWRVQRIVDRTLQLVIEICVDVGAHVISDRQVWPPGTYAETFEILRDAGLIGSVLCAFPVRMARFRNLLVHEYARIEPELVVRILRENLVDLDAFRRVAADW